MPDTAVAAPDAGLSPAQLAARHGLTAAGEQPGLLAYIRQLWAYRHFIAAYANAHVTSSFSRTRLGRLWQVLTPLSNAAVYYLIFGVVLKTSRDMDNFIAYLCTGLFLFIFSQTAVSSGIQSITGNLGLIRALHFPRACLPIAMTLIQLQNILASIGVLFVIVLVTGEPLTLEWLIVVPALLLQTIFNMGLALFVARLGAKLTDLKQLVPFVTRTWMYSSAILYSAEFFRENLPPVAAQILELNPLLVYIELVRHALMEGAPIASPLPQLWLLAVGWALLAGLGGFLYFWRGEKEYGRG